MIKTKINFTTTMNDLPKHCGECEFYKKTTESYPLGKKHYCPFTDMGIKIDPAGSLVNRPKACPLGKVNKVDLGENHKDIHY